MIGRQEFSTSVYSRHICDWLDGCDSNYYHEAAANVNLLSAMTNLYGALCVSSFLPALITLGIILIRMTDLGFSQTYKDMPVAFYLFIAFIVAGIVAFIIFYKLAERKRFELVNYRERSGAVVNRMVSDSFNLPENNMAVDYFQICYSPTSGKSRNITALTVIIYYDRQNLYLLDGNILLKIPKSEMRYSETAEEKIKFFSGIDDIQSQKYRDFGVCAADNRGRFGCRNYGVFVFDDGRETYSIEVLPNSYEKLRALFNR